MLQYKTITERKSEVRTTNLPSESGNSGSGTGLYENSGWDQISGTNLSDSPDGLSQCQTACKAGRELAEGVKKLEKMKYLQRGYWNSNRKAAVSWQCPAVMGQIVNRDKECERTVTFFRKNCSKYIKRVTI